MRPIIAQRIMVERTGWSRDLWRGGVGGEPREGALDLGLRAASLQPR
jgi:hypothetical protein